MIIMHQSNTDVHVSALIPNFGCIVEVATGTGNATNYRGDYSGLVLPLRLILPVSLILMEG